MSSHDLFLPVRRPPSALVVGILILVGTVVAGLVLWNPLAAAVAVVGLGLLMLFAAHADVAIMIAMVGRTLVGLLPGSTLATLPGLPRGFNVEALIALFVVMGALVYLLAHRLPIARAPLTVPWLLFLAALLVTVTVSLNRTTTVLYWVRMLSYFVVYIVVFAFVRHSAGGRHRWWTYLVVWSLLLPAVAWVHALVTGEGMGLLKSSTLPRLRGPFGGLEFGTLLMIPMLLATVQVAETRGPARWWWLMALGFIALSFALSQSRGPWAGYLAATVVLGLLRYRALPFVVLAAGLALFLLVPGLGARVREVVVSPEETSLANRMATWSGAVQLFRERPLLGTGFGVGYSLAAYVSRGTFRLTHSDYVRVLADAGLVGLAAFLLWIVAQGLHGVRVWRAVRDPFHQRVALTFIGAWTAYLVARATGNVLTHADFNFQFWTLAGLASALPALERGQDA